MVFSYAILRTPALRPSTVVDHIDTDAHGMSGRSDLYPWRNHASIRTPPSTTSVFMGGMVRWTMVACGARDANEGRPSPLFVAFLKKLGSPDYRVANSIP